MKNAESLLPCHCEDVPVAIHDRGTNSAVQGSQICHCEEANGRRGALSAKREEVPLGCNLGKALPEWERHRRPYMLPGLTVAAFPERHAG